MYIIVFCLFCNHGYKSKFCNIIVSSIILDITYRERWRWRQPRSHKTQHKEGKCMLSGELYRVCIAIAACCKWKCMWGHLHWALCSLQALLMHFMHSFCIQDHIWHVQYSSTLQRLKTMHINMHINMHYTPNTTYPTAYIYSPMHTLQGWELVGIWLSPLGNAGYVACLLLLCQGSKWLNGKSVWLVFRRYWVQIPAGSWIFFLWIYFSLSQQNIIQDFCCTRVLIWQYHGNINSSC